ncbi:hypothetical protein [Fluviicola sp.]|uniref:hypothetical protein n=1 Tax=Fluviicola sp. TaxID=1917219 RepID=UPI00260CF334|nr:hypothetical protein [Fluviicola sp.]
MYLLTTLNKRTKTISWFLIHVFVLQIIPFSSFAGSANQLPVNLAQPVEAEKIDLARAILALSELESKESKTSEVSSNVFKQPSQNLQLKSISSVSSSGGGFSPGSMNDMVDPFTGDFSYSIPLMDVEGYPLTLSYNSNVTMSSEATWVGLGWNLDVGSVSREMRGIPDDFNGDQYITSTYKVKKDETNDGFKAGGYMAISAGFGSGNIGVAPKLQLTALWGRYTNSYLGLGKTFDIGLQAAVNLSYSNDDISAGPGLKFGLGYSSDTKGGVGFNKSFGITADYGPKNGKTGPYAGVGVTFGNNFNSRHGLIAKTQSFNASAGYVASASVEDERDSETNKLLKRGEGASTFGAAYGASSSIPYGTAASMPRLRRTTSSKSDAFMTDLYFGFALKPITMKIGGILETYTTSTELSGPTSVIKQPAYGYLHSGKRAGENESFSVMDFDRGTDFAFSENMKNLPFSIQAFDVFHVSSSGLNAQFRANRSDIGTYYDASVQGELNHDSELLINDDMKAVNAGVLLGAGVTVEAGYSTAVNRGETESGKWHSGVNFNSVPAGSKFDPDTYFKAVGEITPNDLTNYNTFGGEAARYFPINKSGSDLNLSQTLDNGTAIYQGSIVNTQPLRATIFEPITVEERMASLNDYDKKIYYFTPTGTSATAELRNIGSRANNHISSIKVVSASGGIYNYGLPNYSLLTSDVSFSIENTGGRIYDDSRGEVSYVIGDDETSNALGKAHMLDRTDIPAYASSFMLTSIVGSDYVDMTNDGPTIDDVGSYHKFDYVRYYDHTNRYKWRFPVSGMNGAKPKAILNKGYLSLSTDDIATYSYSEREVYYPKSVSGKNLIAVFELKDRHDAYGVKDKNGLLETSMPLQCLDKIKLYNLSDYNQNPNAAVPLQVVEFEYDYSLCLNAPNNPETYNHPNSFESGKLTLKSIRTYTGTSQEMGRSKTIFTYNNGPDYNHLNVDRWGNYKVNDPNLPNNLYPAAIQNETLANEHAKFWKLASITTPAGGEMSIAYEADSYGFVQNKRAMRHFQIAGMLNLYQCRAVMNGEAWNTSNLSNEFRNDSYDPNLLLIDGNFFKKYGTFEKNLTPNNMLVFKLERPID